jgi:hypothetical protein
MNNELKQKAIKILSNVEFLHRVPVSAPEDVKEKIIDLIDEAVKEERGRIIDVIKYHFNGFGGTLGFTQDEVISLVTPK